MKKPIKEKIEYLRKMPDGTYKEAERTNPYKQIVRLQGTKQVSRKNFIRSYNRHLDKNFISVEFVGEEIFLLHYASHKPLKEGDGIWQVPQSNPDFHSKDILLFTVNQMAELEAWKSKDYKKILKAIIIENSVSKFGLKFKSDENCYLLYSKDKFEKLLQERMGISQKMAKRLTSGLRNRIKFPFLYNQEKLTDSSQPTVSSEKELFLELNLYAILKSVVSGIDTFRENFLDEETTDEERVDIIVDYIMADEHDSYTNSKIAYELGDTDISLGEYSKNNYGDVFKEINGKKEDYITQFKTFLDGTIDYLKVTSQGLVRAKYLVDSIAEKIVPFMELNLLESALEEIKNEKIKYAVRIDINEDIKTEYKDAKDHFENIMEKLQEGKELYELYKEQNINSGISIILDSALASEHKRILEQFIRYDQGLVLDIASPDPMIDLHEVLSHERDDYMDLTNEVREIAKVLDITVHLAF